MSKANSGNPEAQFELGIAYDRGLGVDKSESEAMRWYRSAANSGHTEAQNNLAYLYETGPDGLKDMAEAAKWYKRSAIYGSFSPGFTSSGTEALARRSLRRGMRTAATATTLSRLCSCPTTAEFGSRIEGM